MLSYFYQGISTFIPCSCHGNYLLLSSLKNNLYYTNEHLKQISDVVNSYKIVLFMKGDARNPKCKFSKRALDLIKSSRAQIIKTVNILEDEGIKNGVKSVSGWNKFPQLFVNGKFICGVDTMEQLYQQGELQNLIQS